MVDKITDFGFNWGSAEVTRLCQDQKKGWVVIGLRTPKKNLQIYVTKSGKIRISEDKGEWKPPEPLQQL